MTDNQSNTPNTDFAQDNWQHISDVADGFRVLAEMYAEANSEAEFVESFIGDKGTSVFTDVVITDPPEALVAAMNKPTDGSVKIISFSVSGQFQGSISQGRIANAMIESLKSNGITAHTSSRMD